MAEKQNSHRPRTESSLQRGDLVNIRFTSDFATVIPDAIPQEERVSN
jgi:putative spermidine/putrescine transport system ATP-binding protein